MTKQEQFFYDYAGYSFDPKTETAEQSHERCAKGLATAENYANANNWIAEWHDDWTLDHQQEFGDNYKDGGPNTCEYCVLKDYSANELQAPVLAALTCIDDATPQYRRVVEAELALEAMGR